MEKFIRAYGHDFMDKFDNVYITSDMHFLHAKIKDFEPIREELRLAEGFEEDADEFLISKWNAQVGNNDLVINVGDLHWKSFDSIYGRLNGVMLLILGNHDNAPQYYEKYEDIYVVSGIWELKGEQFLKYHVDSTDRLLSAFIYDDVLISHYPIYNIEHEYNYQRQGANSIISRMNILLDVYKGSYNIHGHMHSACPEGTENSLNVCIDFNRFKILDFKESLIKVRK